MSLLRERAQVQYKDLKIRLLNPSVPLRHPAPNSTMVATPLKSTLFVFVLISVTNAASWWGALYSESDFPKAKRGVVANGGIGPVLNAHPEAKQFCSAYLSITPYAATTTVTAADLQSITITETDTNVLTVTPDPFTTVTTVIPADVIVTEASTPPDASTTVTVSLPHETATATSTPDEVMIQETTAITSTVTTTDATITLSPVETDTTTITDITVTSTSTILNKRRSPVVPIPAYLQIYNSKFISAGCSAIVTFKTKTVHKTVSPTTTFTATTTSDTLTTLATDTVSLTTTTDPATVTETTTLNVVTDTTSTTLPVLTDTVTSTLVASTTTSTETDTSYTTEHDTTTFTAPTSTIFFTAEATTTSIIKTCGPSMNINYFSGNFPDLQQKITEDKTSEGCCERCHSTTGCSFWAFGDGKKCYIATVKGTKKTISNTCPTGKSSFNYVKGSKYTAGYGACASGHSVSH